MGDFNVVMMDLDQARTLRAQIEAWSPDTTILPMVAFATRSERSVAKREFGQVLSLPAAMTRVLSAVDQSL